MEWRDCKEDIERFNTISQDELKAIVRDGAQSEFWKYVRSRLAVTMMRLEQALIRTSVQSMDDSMKLARFAEAYKSAEEIFNIPEFVLGSLQKTSALRTPPSVKTGENHVR